MNSHLSEEQISAWLSGERGTEADCHVRECPQCTAEIERVEKALLLFRDSGFAIAEYWRARPQTRAARHHGRWGIHAAAGVAVAAAILAAVLVQRKPETPAQPGQEVFTRIPYVVPPAPYERTEVVRMDVPVAALIAAGIRMEAPASDSISTDVLLGQDGRPLAVGFPENNQ